MKWFKNKLFVSSALSLIFGFLGAYIFQFTNTKTTSGLQFSANTPVRNVNLANTSEGFVKASGISTPTVVFIKSESTVQYSSPFGWFWDFDPFGSKGKSQSTGSGVIIRNDGYIVTNNHVVAGADKVTVVLSQKKQEYTAKVVGSDPNSDLAVLKIEAKDLPTIVFANSDNVMVGDWVIAVGNPFNLTSTVTAGIVSAKGRNININQNQFPLESFIQTDAAINPGNSGGALVNTNGELVGINTAIQSNTGSYTGYGFAIPSNVVSKIVKDFIEFGEVKRAFTGLDVTDISAQQYASLNLDVEGVIVKDVVEGGPAAKAGLKENDVIVKINGKPTTSKALYDEHLAYFRPGQSVKLTVIRAGKEMEFDLTLINNKETTALLQKGAVSSKLMGADFQPLSKTEMSKFNLSSGIKVINVVPGGNMNEIGISNGFIITKFNGKEYSEPEDLISAMEDTKGRFNVEGINKNGGRQSFSFYSY